MSATWKEPEYPLFLNLLGPVFFFDQCVNCWIAENNYLVNPVLIDFRIKFFPGLLVWVGFNQPEKRAFSSINTDATRVVTANSVFRNTGLVFRVIFPPRIPPRIVAEARGSAQ